MALATMALLPVAPLPFAVSLLSVPWLLRDALLLLPSEPSLAASHFSQSWSMAAFIKKASSIGAGPLIVMLTEVLGSQRSKPLYNFLASSTVAMLTPALPILP